ncbi:MAG: hypothetical protein AAGF56_00985 [Pseudomonadota bacterium]
MNNFEDELTPASSLPSMAADDDSAATADQAHSRDLPFPDVDDLLDRLSADTAVVFG